MEKLTKKEAIEKSLHLFYYLEYGARAEQCIHQTRKDYFSVRPVEGTPAKGCYFCEYAIQKSVYNNPFIDMNKRICSLCPGNGVLWGFSDDGAFCISNSWSFYRMPFPDDLIRYFESITEFNKYRMRKMVEGLEELLMIENLKEMNQ